jgi:hypothetical protein
MQTKVFLIPKAIKKPWPSKPLFSEYRAADTEVRALQKLLENGFIVGGEC